MTTQDEVDFQINKIKAIDIEDDPFARQKLLKDWDQDKVKNAKVLVVGAGALGNEVLKNLALLGVGNILIIDFDTVSKSNLSRTILFKTKDKDKEKAAIAAERTASLCVEKSARIGYISGNIVNEVGDGLYANFDVIIGCTDNLEARLAISRGCWLSGTPWVDVSISGYNGNVVIYKPFDTFCFMCTMSDDDYKDVRKRYSCDHRKLRSYADRKIPTIQTLSSIIAGIQVQEALRLIHQDYSMAGKRIRFNGSLNILDTSISVPVHGHELPEKNHENHHGTYVGQKIEKMDLSAANTKLFEFLSKTGLVGKNFELKLPMRRHQDFVLYSECNNCGHKVDILQPIFKIFADQHNQCSVCGIQQPNNPESEDSLTMKFKSIASFPSSILDDKLLNLTLLELGYSPLDILPVKTGNEIRYYELSADAINIFPHKKGNKTWQKK